MYLFIKYSMYMNLFSKKVLSYPLSNYSNTGILSKEYMKKISVYITQSF